jgi:hypothetical protein
VEAARIGARTNDNQYSKGANRKAMSTYAKRQGRVFRTPITTYAHPDTGRRVTVVSVMHIGLPSHFAELREIIKEREATGVAVHCEGTGLDRLTPDLVKQSLTSTTSDTKVQELLVRIPDLIDDEREVLLAMVDVELLARRRIRELGWVGQMDKEGGLPNEPHWQDNDVTVFDVIRRLGPDTMLYRTRQAKKLLDWQANNRVKPNAFRLKVALVFRACSSNKKSIQDKLRTGPYDAVLLERREKVALDGLHATTTDVVLLWVSCTCPLLRPTCCPTATRAKARPGTRPASCRALPPRCCACCCAAIRAGGLQRRRPIQSNYHP